MKIRIKETGELLEDVKFIDTTLHKITIQYLDDGVLRECMIKNLSDIEEVKDYEEPKEYWYINTVINRADRNYRDSEDLEDDKVIGNYFDTREEAEKAVEKLKAWKRLKDKGFKFEGWDNTDRSTIHNFSLFVAIEDLENINRDLDLLFGGEE